MSLPGNPRCYLGVKIEAAYLYCTVLTGPQRTHALFPASLSGMQRLLARITAMPDGGPICVSGPDPDRQRLTALLSELGHRVWELDESSARTQARERRMMSDAVCLSATHLAELCRQRFRG